MQVRLLCQNIDFHSYLIQLIKIPEDKALITKNLDSERVEFYPVNHEVLNRLGS
jgi:hypothetical protein